MKLTTAPTLPRLRRRTHQPRRRAAFPALTPAAHGLAACAADHDFLIPNPRPDLTLDPQTLAMLER